jgi:spore germination protein GerM
MDTEKPTTENNNGQPSGAAPSGQPTQGLSQPVAPHQDNTSSPAAQESTPVVNNVQAENNPQVSQNQGANSGAIAGENSMRKWRWAIGILLVLAVLWYFSNQERQKLGDTSADQDEVTITVSDEQEQGTVTITEESSQNLDSSASPMVDENSTLVKVYYLNSKNNPNLADCSEVEAIEKRTERKYSSQIINTMRGLLEPLTAEQKAAGWSSAIPEGVLLKSVMIRDGGVAEANFTGNLRVAGSCAVTAVRAQIEQTLKQFPGVNSVRICIDGNCNQSTILQP